MSRYPAFELEGALVAITGAARGIGLETAKAFLAEGAYVAIGDLDDELAAKVAVELGDRVSAHKLDVTDKASFATFLTEAEAAHGRTLDVLVNNAGVMPNGAFLEQSDHLDELTMNVNVYGLIHGMRAAAPGMIERGQGHIVNICSLAGKFPIKGLAVYNASKFAAVGLSAATRLELDQTGVSVSAVLPSAVKTELASGIDYGILPAVEPEDVAAAVVRSVKSRQAEIAVPGYMGAAEKFATLVPEPLMRGFRAAVKDDRAITHVNDGVRKKYLDRISGKA